MTPATQAALLRLATRGSPLARAQAELASTAIHAAGGPQAELVIVRTEGDRHQSTPIEDLAGQGWFTTAIERTLLDGRADVAVHAAKDLPTELAPGLGVAAVLPRADPRDCVVTRDGGGLDVLPDGARVGSSSARRAALLGDLRPGLLCVPIRGNVDTRLRKLEEGEVDAIIVAVAGLERLGLAHRVGQHLDPHSFVPAPAQGAIALEVVSGGPATAAVAAVCDDATDVAVRAERALLRAMGGGCLLPLGAWARLEEGALVLSAALGIDGAVRRAEMAGPPSRPDELVERVTAALR